MEQKTKPDTCWKYKGCCWCDGLCQMPVWTSLPGYGRGGGVQGRGGKLKTVHGGVVKGGGRNFGLLLTNCYSSMCSYYLQ